MKYFQSVYLPAPDDSTDKPVLHSYNLDSMPAIQISDSDVYRKLSELDVSKANGPDQLSAFLLKSYADIFCGPL